MRKTYKAFMQFSLAELKAELQIKEAGVTIGMAATDSQDYSLQATQHFNIDLKDIQEPILDGMIVPENLLPKKEDFLFVPFRLISATMVAANSWRATFFKESVLKKAVGMLQGKGVYTDHDDRPKNWLGYVAKTKWQSKQLQDGEQIPAGINGLLGIDTTLERNKDIAKGIINGAIYSNSVGIMLNYKMSHIFEDEWEFRRRVGTIAEDGRMIHLEVTEIIDIYETSLVGLGADPYAKRIGSNGLINVDNGGTYKETQTNQFKTEFSKENETNKFNICCGLDRNVLLLTGKKFIRTSLNNKQDINMNKELLASLMAFFKVEKEEDLTEEMVKGFSTPDTKTTLSLAQAKEAATSSSTLGTFLEKHIFISTIELENMKQSVSKVVELSAQLDTLLKENIALEVEKTALAIDAKVGTDFIQMQRDLAKKFYRLDKMDKADETVLSLFDKANLTELTALIKQHGVVIGGKFSYSCSDCGSTHFEFGSSVETESTRVETKNVVFVNPDTIRSKYRQNEV